MKQRNERATGSKVLKVWAYDTILSIPKCSSRILQSFMPPYSSTRWIIQAAFLSISKFRVSVSQNRCWFRPYRLDACSICVVLIPQKYAFFLKEAVCGWKKITPFWHFSKEIQASLWHFSKQGLTLAYSKYWLQSTFHTPDTGFCLKLALKVRKLRRLNTGFYSLIRAEIGSVPAFLLRLERYFICK